MLQRPNLVIPVNWGPSFQISILDTFLGRKLKMAIESFEVKVDLQKGVLRFG